MLMITLYADKNLKRLIDELVGDSLRLIQWFADNQMKANPGNRQAIAVGKHTHNEDIPSVSGRI